MNELTSTFFTQELSMQLSLVLDQIALTEKAVVDHKVANYRSALLKGIQNDPIKKRPINWRQIAVALDCGWSNFKTLAAPDSCYAHFITMLTVPKEDDELALPTPLSPAFYSISDQSVATPESPTLYALPETVFEENPLEGLAITIDCPAAST